MDNKNTYKNTEFHIPVMVKEVIDNLITDKNGIYVDCTFGGGGHSLEILKNITKNGRIIAFDQDKDVQQNIDKINDKRITFINSNFKYISNFLNYNKIETVDGIFADLGVSSYQIDNPNRGFSTRFDGDLDMRMNTEIQNNAFNIINNYDKKKLAYIFKNYGDLYNCEKIADIIISNRRYKKIKTTFDLKNIILENIKIGKLFENKFFAKLFQSIRIEVNDELNNLEILLNKSTELLKKNGKLVILAYHSLEDRIVKVFLKNSDKIKAITKKPLIPSTEEILNNKRSRSAKLRVGIKI